MNLVKLCQPWDELTIDSLYRIIQLRMEVFVVEQDCPYLDTDDKDQLAHHVSFFKDNNLVAYTRLLPKGVSYENYCSIGRVVNSAAVRGQGIGKELMEYSIQNCQNLYPKTPIKISAQVYLLKFYNELGFQETGDRYLEDGIPHCGMILDSSK